MLKAWRLLLLLGLTVFTVSAAGSGLDCGYSWQQAICRGAPAEFSFSDGCNTVTCDGRGEYISTLMACSAANTETEKQQCDNIRREVQARLDTEFTVACPMLAVSAVCATAPRGFTYNDGCNSVTCDGAGSGISTLRFCPPPEKFAEIAACERRTKKLIDRLDTPRTCSGINSSIVCLSEGAGFRFSDGCNTIECGPNATWSTTLMNCDPAAPNTTFCQWVYRQARISASSRSAPSSGGSGGGGGGGGGSGETDDREFACASLAFSRVCTAQVVGFRYNDGCNEIHCVSPGNAVSTFRLCAPAGDKDAAAEAVYCQRAELQMEARRGESQARFQCLTAADVCLTPGEKKSFFDGCNYCFCMGVNRAGCTRRACRPYFSTEADFKEECKRRKAGVITD